MSGDRERYLAEGMNGYISKPIERQALLTEIAGLLTADAAALPEVADETVSPDAAIEHAAEADRDQAAAPDATEAARPARDPASCQTRAAPMIHVDPSEIRSDCRALAEAFSIPGSELARQAGDDLCSVMRSAIEALPHGFAIIDSDLRPIMSNGLAREAFSEYYSAVDEGLSHREATFAILHRNRPDASDDQCWEWADEMDERLRQGLSVDLTADDGRICRIIYRRMSHDRYVRVALDITDERRREAELEDSRRQADLANRAKSAFLANMSHEIRTPLNGILGMAQVLVQSDLTAFQSEQAEAILESGKTLKMLLDDVLDLSKIEAGRMELAPLEARIEPILKSHYGCWAPRAQEKGIALVLDIAAGVPDRVLIDPIRFEQCLNNLTSNAIKFTGRDEVRINVRADEQPEGVLITVTVSDTGTGAARHSADALFTPFPHGETPASRGQGGTGLGLTVTRRLAQLMGGDVVLESEEGKGSTFTFTLMTMRLSHTQCLPGNVAQIHEDVAEQDDVRGRRILLVDDHPVNRRVGRLFLEPEGYQVTEANDGIQALEKLDMATFDLILLDIHMPMLDGLQTLKRIRATAKPWRTLPVIAMTADAMSGDRERYIAEGMDGYVSKPIDRRDLLSEVARLIDERRADPAEPLKEILRSNAFAPPLTYRAG